MKRKTVSLVLALALCLSLAAPALAVESTTANLTPQAAKAYKDIVDSLYREYGAPIGTKETYYGMCGGYVVDLGDSGAPEMIVAYSKKSSSSIIDIPSSYIKVYTWNGTKAVMVYEYQVLASLNGRSWNTFTLCQNGNTAWLEVKWESLPDAFTGEEFEPMLTRCHMENGEMKGFTPQTKASSSAQLGAFDYITFNNLSELSTFLTNAANAAPAVGGFTDVKASDWYADPVKWAVEKGITNGTGKNTFSPDKTCNNAEILTFLWRACGKPKAEAAGGFTDVASTAWYADAAVWAKSKGMISGSRLSPETPCTRASAVMFIWQAMGKPAASSAASFSDVDKSADYAAAVAWAVENGVTTGTGVNTFSPNDTCTRGQIVTFLYRDMGNANSKPAADTGNSSAKLMARAMLDKISELGSTEAYLLDMNADGTPELICYNEKIPDSYPGGGGYRAYRWDGRKLYEHQFDYHDPYGGYVACSEKTYGQEITKCRNEYALVFPIIFGTGSGAAIYFLDHTDTLVRGYDSPVDETEEFAFNWEDISEARYNQLFKEYGLGNIDWSIHTARTDLPDAKTELNKLLAG